MTFSLKHARYFVATARTGQVSRAAVELNVSQSAVTGAIHQLESLLGLQLFERRSSGMFLTVVGTRFLHHAEHIVAAVNEASRISADLPQSPSGRLNVGLTYTVSGYFAVPILFRMQRMFPKLQIDLREMDRTDVERGLVDGSLDLAIVLTANLKETTHVAYETLVRSQRRVWFSGDHPFAQQQSVSLAEVATQPYIGLTVDEAMKTQVSYWTAAGVKPNVIFETTSVEAVRTMVAAGMGVTVLSDLVYRPWSLDGQRIETCTLRDPVPAMDVGLAWSAARGLSEEAAIVSDFIRRNLPSDARTAKGLDVRK